MSAKRIKLDVEDRKGVIGGSQLGAMLGLSKYQTVHDVWKTWMGEEKEVTPEQAEIFEMGHQLEEFIAHQTERLFGVKLQKSSYAYVHPTEDWLICHPDRLIVGTVDGKRIGVEIKSSSSYDNKRWGDADTDDIPADYLVQCHDYMMCGVCDEVWLIRFSNNRVTRYIVKADRALEDKILSQAKAVMESWLRGEEPEAESFEEAKNIYTRETEGDILADADIKKVVEEWESLKLQVSDLNERIDAKKALIVAYLKDKQTLVNEYGDILATYKKISTTKFDSKSLKNDDPKLYEKYVRTSSYMKLT